MAQRANILSPHTDSGERFQLRLMQEPGETSNQLIPCMPKIMIIFVFLALPLSNFHHNHYKENKNKNFFFC